MSRHRSFLRTLPASLPNLPLPARLDRDERTERAGTARLVRGQLLSLAGLLGATLRSRSGAPVGRLLDVIARWDGAEPFPPVVGLVVRVGFRPAFVPVSQIERVKASAIELNSLRLDLRDFERRPGEVRLAHDVLDHQLVDIDGVQVVRANDLYLTGTGPRLVLVAADVGVQSLIRRLGPRRWRGRPTLDRVIDWGAIQPFGESVSTVRLRSSKDEALARLRPGQLADLLEDLDRTSRQELLTRLEPEVAADALEEMEDGDLNALLRDLPTSAAADLLEAMEPDEAVEALRHLDEDEREELLTQVDVKERADLDRLLLHDSDTAGGLMTSYLLSVPETATVAEVRALLTAEAEHRFDLDSVLVVGDDGRLVDDVSVFELLVAQAEQLVSELVGPPWPVTVDVATRTADIIDAFVGNRGTSVVVVDQDHHPVGRILSDDVIDRLATTARRRPLGRLRA